MNELPENWMSTRIQERNTQLEGFAAKAIEILLTHRHNHQADCEWCKVVAFAKLIGVHPPGSIVEPSWITKRRQE